MIREYIIKVDEGKKDIMGDCPLVEKPKELVRCKDCKHKPEFVRKDNYGNWYKFPDDICPCQNGSDDYYSYCPEDDWFCADGERKDGEGE